MIGASDRGTWSGTVCRACRLISVVAAVGPSVARAQTPGPPPAQVVEYNLMVPMRDGIRLATDVYRPSVSGRYPVILVRNPYGNGSEGVGAGEGEFWAARGYVYLHQDVRGRFDSEGAWYPFIHEAKDGYDTIEWAAAQPWSNGRLAMRHASYLAYVQWLAAALRPPHLTALVPTFSPLDPYRDVHPGGAFEVTRIAWAVRMNGRTFQNFRYDWDRALRHVPILTMDEALGHRSPWWRDIVTHAERDGYWAPLDAESQLDKVAVPVLHIGGWYDTFLHSTLAAYTGMRKRGATSDARELQRMVIGPWPHSVDLPGKTGEVDFGASAGRALVDVEGPWLERRLKGVDNGLDRRPRVELFVMGENRWRWLDGWPPPEAASMKWYLGGGGTAATEKDGALSPTPPGNEEPPDRFTYDPADPVPTRGGALPGATPGLRPGPFDQREIEARPDVLVYTSAPLQEDLTVIGPVEVVLYAASSARDTDFTAKLVDVQPDGRAYNLADGIVRARYRESTERPSLLEPNREYRYRIDLVATANVFRRGHRIRVEISSSNFPRFSRNPNTGSNVAGDTALVKARQTVYHDRTRPSHLLLSVLARPAS